MHISPIGVYSNKMYSRNNSVKQSNPEFKGMRGAFYGGVTGLSTAFAFFASLNTTPKDYLVGLLTTTIAGAICGSTIEDHNDNNDDNSNKKMRRV